MNAPTPTPPPRAGNALAHTTRRAMLFGLGGAALAAASACGPTEGPTPKGSSKAAGTLTWWDHFAPLEALHKEVFAQVRTKHGITVQHTLHQTAKLGQALQLARQSNQLPDVHTNVGIELPLRQMIDDKWYQPLQLSSEAEALLPDEAKVEGITTFDGSLYSFPIFNFRQYWAATWFDRELLEQSGLDPDAPPSTYDEFRAACRSIKQGGKANGWINNLGAKARVGEQTHFLAQAAGFEGNGGTLFRSGEIALDSDEYVNAIEFMYSLKKDGLLVEGQFNDAVARSRWAAGQAGFYFDGPWCPGAVKADAAKFLPKMDVGPMLVPEKNQPVTAYRGASGGAFFVSGSSKQPEVASAVIAEMLTPEYAKGLATNMDQPPTDLDIVASADVHASYKKVMTLFADACFLAPQAVVRNPEVAKVTAKIPAPKPDLGEIVQGVFSGQVTDVRKALTELTSKSRAARAKAFADAKLAGSDLDESVFAFDNWSPRTDYTQQMYSG